MSAAHPKILVVLAVSVMLLAFLCILFFTDEPYWISRGKFNEPITQMMLAAWEGDFNRVSKLVEQGHDVNETTESGSNALFFAVRGSNYSVANYLISAGADPNMRDDLQSLMIFYVAKKGDVQFLQYLFNHIDSKSFACQNVLRQFTESCDISSLTTILESLGNESRWGAEVVRQNSHIRLGCSEEINRLISKYDD